MPSTAFADVDSMLTVFILLFLDVLLLLHS